MVCPREDRQLTDSDSPMLGARAGRAKSHFTLASGRTFTLALSEPSPDPQRTGENSASRAALIRTGGAVRPLRKVVPDSDRASVRLDGPSLSGGRLFSQLFNQQPASTHSKRTLGHPGSMTREHDFGYSDLQPI